MTFGLGIGLTSGAILESTRVYDYMDNQIRNAENLIYRKREED